MNAGSLAARRLLLAAGGLAALTGVPAGLARVGLDVGWTSTYAAGHGPLLVVGLFGTVIALERAAALGRGWAMPVPLLAASSTAAILVGSPVAPWFAVASAFGLVVVNAALVRRRPALFAWLTPAASGLLLVGAMVWASDRPIHVVVPAWAGFLVVTIAAERLRWSRRAPPPCWALHAMSAIAFALAAAACARVIGVLAADHWLGAAMALLAAWQLRFDIARRALASDGMARFIGLGVQAGAAWLLAGGLLIAWYGLPPAGPVYDAALHAIFVGHVFGTVFAHAPTMLASVAAVRVPFTGALYVPVALLHLTLLARLGGDLLDSLAWRRAGSIGNAVAIAAFGVIVAGARRKEEGGRSEE